MKDIHLIAAEQKSKTVNELICPKCKGELKIDFSMPTLDMYPCVYAVECQNCDWCGSFQEKL